MNGECGSTSVVAFPVWEFGTFVHIVSCYQCYIVHHRNWVLDEELNSIVGTHCICWKLAIKNGIAACEWERVYRNLDCSVDIDACLQTDTSWLKWSINGSRQTNEILLEKAAFHFRCHLYWARSVLNIFVVI